MAKSRTSQARCIDSYYRTSQYEDYGGRPWCHILLALGDVPERIVAIMHDIAKERRQAWEEQALATTQGRATGSRGALFQPIGIPRQDRPAPVFGVQHTESAAKRARRQAKNLDKRCEQQQELWRSGKRQRCLSWPQWEHLQRQRDQAWDVAERLSEESGAPYFDRHGTRRNDEDPRDMVGIALRRYCEECHIPYQ